MKRTARWWLLGFAATPGVGCSVYEPTLLPILDAALEAGVAEPSDGASPPDGDAETAPLTDGASEVAFDGPNAPNESGVEASDATLADSAVDARAEAEAAPPICDAACMVRCTDRVLNGTETRIDCGGECPAEMCPPLPTISNLMVNDMNLGQDSITNNVQWSIETSFADGQSIYGDRSTTDVVLGPLPAAAAHLAGKPWIKTAADSKLYSAQSAPVATATLTGSFVFIAIDDRQTMTSLSADGYVYQFYKVSLYENETLRTLSVLRKPIVASPMTVTFPSVTSVTSFYLIVVE